MYRFLFLTLVLFSACSHAPEKKKYARVGRPPIGDFEKGYFYSSDLETVRKPKELAGEWMLVDTFCDKETCDAPFFRVSVVPANNLIGYEAHYWNSEGIEDKKPVLELSYFAMVPAAYRDANIQNGAEVKKLVSDPCTAFVRMSLHFYLEIHSRTCKSR